MIKRTAYHTLVEYKLETGRKNQIRVHSADMGHPVCGDTKYGNGDDPNRTPLSSCLYPCVLPSVTHKPLHFETPIPSDFKRIVK